MQFDLGAVTTVIYGKSIAKYLDKYSGFNNNGIIPLTNPK
jgi:hypothetical protein